MKLQVPETTEDDTTDKRGTTILLLYKLETLEVGTMNHKGQSRNEERSGERLMLFEHN